MYATTEFDDNTQGRQPVLRASELLRADGAAEYLGGVSPASVLRWARKGQLKSYRVGKSIRFHPHDLDVYVQSRARN